MKTVKVLCNVCGKESSTDSFYHMEDFFGRYGSDHDGEPFEFDICPECMDKLAEKCVINPFTQLVDDADDLGD